MAGLGTSGIGVTPYGPGLTPTAAEPPRDRPDGAKFINHLTKDYERAADGSYKRMPRTRHRVMLAIGTELGSSTVQPKLGTQYPDKIGESYQDEAQLETARALENLIDEQEIVLGAVTTEQVQTGRVAVTIPYATSEGEPDQVKL